MKKVIVVVLAVLAVLAVAALMARRSMNDSVPPVSNVTTTEKTASDAVTPAMEGAWLPIPELGVELNVGAKLKSVLTYDVVPGSGGSVQFSTAKLTTLCGTDGGAPLGVVGYAEPGRLTWWGPQAPCALKESDVPVVESEINSLFGQKGLSDTMHAIIATARPIAE